LNFFKYERIQKFKINRKKLQIPSAGGWAGPIGVSQEEVLPEQDFAK
jgi:hypothetical protein